MKQNSKYRWVVFVSVLVTYLLMASQRTAPGLITEQLMKDFSVTATTIGLLTSVQFLLYTTLQIPMGVLADRFGPNFFLIFGASLTGFGTIIYSIGAHESILFLARILTGIGDATIWVNIVLILGHWFIPKDFVRLIGFAGMTGSLGFLLATVPFSSWIELLGWRKAFLSAGLLLVVLGIVLYVVLIKKPKQLFMHEQAVEVTVVQKEKTIIRIKRIFSNHQAWALFFCHFGVVGGYVGFISSWAVPFGVNMYEMSLSEASELIMIGLFGALIGAPLTSWISSRLQNIKAPYMIVHLFVLISWFSFLLCKGQPSLFLLTMLFFVIGFGYGASALTFAAVRQSFPISEAGLVSGFANTGGFLSAVLLPMIFGFILDYVQGVTGSKIDGYVYGFITPVIFSIIGLIGISLFKDNQKSKVKLYKEQNIQL